LELNALYRFLNTCRDNEAQPSAPKLCESIFINFPIKDAFAVYKNVGVIEDVYRRISNGEKILLFICRAGIGPERILLAASVW
jgi:hypothetical protein